MLQRAALGALALALIAGAYALGLKLGAPPTVAAIPPVEAVRAALDEPDALVRIGQLAEALREANADEFAAVIDLFEERIHLAPPGRPELELFGEAWARHDPRGAIDRLVEWPGTERRFALVAVGRAWARAAPNAALSWADSLVLDDRSAMIEAVFQGWAETGDSEVWKALDTMTPGVDREAGTNVVMKWKIQNEGFDALFDEVDALRTRYEPGSPRDFKLNALRSAVGLAAFHDPEKALAFARRYADTPYDNGLLRRIAIFWVVNDGPSAMEAILALPESEQRNKAARDGYTKWLRTNGPAAIAWMPDAALRDERYASITDIYAVSLARAKSSGDRPEAIRAAIAWAEQIENAERRRKTLVLLGAMWSKSEPEAAFAWAEKKGLERAVEAESQQRVVRD